MQGLATFKNRAGKLVSITCRCQFPFLAFGRYDAFRAGMAARLGVEPRQTESESVVLPLHHRAVNPFTCAEATGAITCQQAAGTRRRLGLPGGAAGAEPTAAVEPAMGLEPATACLQNRCSAIELRRRVPPTIGLEDANNNQTTPTTARRAGVGGSLGTRTPNLLIKSQLLYQLS